MYAQCLSYREGAPTCRLDNPLVLIAAAGWETSSIATRLAAQVWGRDDGGGGLTFHQRDIDRVVQAADHRGPAAGANPMTEYFGRSILSLCVSDTNKKLLLANESFIPLLVDSLLLDPKHPRMQNVAIQGTTDWEGAKGPVQRDFTEAIAQLAVFPPGREALLQDPIVAEALQQVAAQGWTEEARHFAEAALRAMSDRPPDAGHHAQQDHTHKHIMLSYQWAVQEVVKRVVNELQLRGYRTWFGAQYEFTLLPTMSSL